MTTEYPNDSDGDALRRLVATGSDMSKPMNIDFQIAAPDEATAKRVADEATKLGYCISIYGSTGAAWNCQCTKSMIPTYASLIAAQAELDAVARSLGARADGWGTYGKGKKYARSGSQPEPAESPPNRRLFQYSLWPLFLATTLLSIAFGLFRVAFSHDFPLEIQFLALLAGLLVCGGGIGVAVWQIITTQKLSMDVQVAITVAVVFVVISLLSYFAVIYWIWKDFSVAG